MSEAPSRVLIVYGTGTDVGKTWVSARLLEGLRARGLAVAAAKPAQSFEPGTGPTDADVLAAATGQEPTAVCPRHRWYETPLAPPMAADALSRPDIFLDDLADELAWPPGTDFGLIETAGGVRSPYATDGDGELFAAIFSDACGTDDLLLVADAGLGTINDVRLSAEVLGGFAVTVFLNRWSSDVEVHRRNRSWLANVDGLHIVVDVNDLVDRWAGDIASGDRRGSL